MNNNKNSTRELIEIKSKVMIRKIDKLQQICEILLDTSKNKKIQFLEVIKTQYLKQYNEIIKKGKYQIYKDVEDIVIKKIAKIELDIDQYICNTSQNYGKIIRNIINTIYQSEDYQNFVGIEKEIKDIETLKQILKLYSPYIDKNEMGRLNNDISVLKFNVLWRKQVEQFIYGKIQEKSPFIQYDNQEEKICFIQQLKRKIKAISLPVLEVELINNYGSPEEKRDNIQVLKKIKTPRNIDDILKDNYLLKKLMIIDMKKNQYNYINLVKANIFNAHLCNIDSDTVVYPKWELIELEQGYTTCREYRYCSTKDGKAVGHRKLNFSLLMAIVKNIIADENISIIECEKLYKNFGFKCRPILINEEQKYVKMLYDNIKKTQEYKKILEESKKNRDKSEKENKNEYYCEIDFKALEYEYDGRNTVREDWDDIATKNIDKIILLIQDRISRINGEEKELSSSFSKTTDRL